MWMFNWKRSEGKNYDKEIKQINDNLNELGNDLNDLDSVAAKKNEVNTFTQRNNFNGYIDQNIQNEWNNNYGIRFNFDNTGSSFTNIDLLRVHKSGVKWYAKAKWDNNVFQNVTIAGATAFTGTVGISNTTKLWRITELGQDNGSDAYILPRKATGKSTLKLGNSTNNDDKRYDINLENRSRILNALDPVADTEVANKRYVDERASYDIPLNGSVWTGKTLNGKKIFISHITKTLNGSGSAELLSNIDKIVSVSGYYNTDYSLDSFYPINYNNPTIPYWRAYIVPQTSAGVTKLWYFGSKSSGSYIIKDLYLTVEYTTPNNQALVVNLEEISDEK